MSEELPAIDLNDLLRIGQCYICGATYQMLQLTKEADGRLWCGCAGEEPTQ